MPATQYALLVAVLFAVAAVLQIVRAVTGLPITIGQTSIPIWASWAVGVVAAILAWLGYAASKG
jgi:hypothetical protein